MPQDAIGNSKQLIDDSMDGDIAWLAGPSGSSTRDLLARDDIDDDEDMADSDHDEDATAEDEGAGVITTSDPPPAAAASSGSGGHFTLDDTIAAGLFGRGGFSFGRRMSGMSSKFNRLRKQLHSANALATCAANAL